MSTATVRSGHSTWAGSTYPSLAHPTSKYLSLKSGSYESFLYLTNPVPRGATVTSATLRLYARSSSTGSRTLTLQRIGASWTISRLTWNHRPSATGSTVTQSISTLSEQSVVEINVTALVQAWANGAPNYGIKITSSGSTTHFFYGMLSSYKPTLVVEWSDKPSAPTRLAPDGVISLNKPTLVFDYTDVSGNTTLHAVQVQIDAAADGASPDFDSGTVLTDHPQLDLNDTAYTGLANGSSTQWRVRVQDGGGLWSDWSTWASITRTNKGTVTINNPSGGFVSETTPPMLWSFSGTQTAYQLRLLRSDRTLLLDTGKITSSVQEYTIPAHILVDDDTYIVNIRVWDNVSGRVASPGDQTYASAETSFVVNVDPTVNPIGSITVTGDTETPWVTVDFTRSTAPDSWTIYRGGKVIEALLDPGLLSVGGTAYRYVDYTADPNRAHTYSVRAVVNGKISPAGPTASGAATPSGIWLSDPDLDLTVTLWGDDEGLWETNDDAAVYTPVGGTKFVRIVSGMRGLSGSLTGLLMEGFGQTFSQQEAALNDLKERPSNQLRLIVGDVNMPVIIGNVRISPKPITRNGRNVKSVAFDFWQMGELAFRPRL